MQEPFWQDWRFWQLIVTAAAALLGFVGGTLIKYALDRRRDRQIERAAAISLATAPHAEISGIRAKAGQLLGLLGQSSGAAPSAFQVGTAIGIPKATIFERNADRLGLLPPTLCRMVVDYYGIRAAAEGMLGTADPIHRRALLGWLLQAANSAPQPLMALDEFLGRPQQDFGQITIEQAPDLPVRNVRALGPTDDVR